DLLLTETVTEPAGDEQRDRIAQQVRTVDPHHRTDVGVQAGPEHRKRHRDNGGVHQNHEKAQTQRPQRSPRTNLVAHHSPPRTAPKVVHPTAAETTGSVQCICARIMEIVSSPASRESPHRTESSAAPQATRTRPRQVSPHHAGASAGAAGGPWGLLKATRETENTALAGKTSQLFGQQRDLPTGQHHVHLTF